MKDVLDKVKDDVNDVVDRAEESMKSAADQAMELTLEAEAKIRKAKDVLAKKVCQSHEYVKQNPEKSVGIALGAGVVMGAIVAFFLRKKR